MKIILTLPILLAMGGCQTIQTVSAGIDTANIAVATADQLLRDKCNYAESGANIAEQVATGATAVTSNSIVRAAATALRNISREYERFCTGKPIVSVADALRRLEVRIVEVRPIAAAVR